MPLRDHFRPPLDDLTSWEGFHGQWPAEIVRHLRTRLPDGFVAEPRVHAGSKAEIDVATFEKEDPIASATDGAGSGGTAVAVWAPARPSVAVRTKLPKADEYGVRVYDARRKRHLVAAIEIVSPANKDREEHRGAFVAKCAALLQQGVAVSIVDLVTTRQFNLYAELLASVGHEDTTLGEEPPPLYAASCRWLKGGEDGLLQAWSHVLALGRPLPVLPLWLSEDLAIPLDLEPSYEQACHDLWIS